MVKTLGSLEVVEIAFLSPKKVTGTSQRGERNPGTIDSETRARFQFAFHLKFPEEWH